MKVLLLTPDLMTASQVAAAAADAGVPLQTADSATQIVQFVCETGAEKVIIDLSTPSLPIANLVAQLQALDPAPHILAFGPHVHVEKLKAARAAGCDEVLTRGQFYEQMVQLLAAAT